MPQRILSLEITDDELKAAVLQTSFRDYKVSAFYRESLNGAGPEASLKRFLDQHGESGDVILSALPGDRVTWRTFFLPFRDAKARVVEAFERAYVAGLLDAHGGKLTAASKHADMDPKNFSDKMIRYGLRRTGPSDPGDGGARST